MPIGRGQFDEAHRRGDGVQRVDDRPRFSRSIEPVGIEADRAEARGRSPEGIGQPPAIVPRRDRNSPSRG